MLDRADCADFGCHNSIRLETKHFLNTLALTFISFSGRFVFAMQKHYLFFCERSSSFFCSCKNFFKIFDSLSQAKLNIHTREVGGVGLNGYTGLLIFYPTAFKGCKGILFNHGV